MKLIILTILACSFAWTANAEKLTVKSKDFTCAELNTLVQDEGTVRIKWLGSLDVHSSPSACRFDYEAYKTSWKTMDKFFCVAGYSCKRNNENNR